MEIFFYFAGVSLFCHSHLDFRSTWNWFFKKTRCDVVVEGYFSHLDTQLAQQYLLFPTALECCLVTSQVSVYLGLLWSLFLSIVSVSAQHPLIELWLYNESWYLLMWVLQLQIISEVVLVPLSPLHFHVNFIVSFSISPEHWDLFREFISLHIKSFWLESFYPWICLFICLGLLSFLQLHFVHHIVEVFHFFG